MAAAEFKTAQPLEYYRQFLREDVRPDGRGVFEFRPTAVNVGSISTAQGSALVRLGNTAVICGIKAELTVPAVDEPNKGFIVPNVDLPPLCSPRYRPGPPSEQAQALSQFMANTISNSEVVKLEDLCIVEGKIVWILHVDIICLDYDGNLFDAALTSMVAALKNTHLHPVAVNEESGMAEPTEEDEITLELRNQPVAATFGIFDDTILFADPTDEEEMLATGVITVVFSAEDGKLHSIHKPGGSPLSDDRLQQCIQLARKRGNQIKELIRTAFSSDKVDR